MTLAAEVHLKAAELGKLAVRMTTRAGSGHPSSGLSLAHLVAYLMYHQMCWDPADLWDPAADRLVLSEGHAVPIIYAALADRGAIVGKSRDVSHRLTPAELDDLRALDSVLDGHPNPAEGVPFFDAATGSLGQGLSVAAGLAAAARLDGTGRRVYCLVGDGESREGQIWEAADFAVDHNLTNLCAIFNANGQGQADNVSPQQSADRLIAKLRAFNWEVVEIDGHDPDSIAGAFARFGKNTRPLAIVARTVKGWGVDELLKGNWHGKPLPESALAEAEASLDRAARAALEREGTVGSDEVAPGRGLSDDEARAGSAQPPGPCRTPWALTPDHGPARLGRGDRATAGISRVEPREVTWPSFSEAMRAAGLGPALEKNQLATRRAYGVALKVAGDLLPQVVALDGDVSNSTFSEIFARAHPRRFFECKIAEQNMVSAGAGFAAAGFIPFVNSFAKFIARAYDQVEMANISRLNLKLVGSHAGISLAADGPSQMALPDVAFFRAFTTVRSDDRESPLCWLLHPADGVAAYQLTRLMTRLPNMCYLRTHRPDVPRLYADDATFEAGGFNVLSGGDDLAIVASGYMVWPAGVAVGLLARQNIRAALIDAYCLPVDGGRLLEALGRCGGRALVVEDNYGGGFGSAVAELAARAGRMRVATLHVQRIPKSARAPQELLEYCGVSPEQIADHAVAMIKAG